MSEFVVFINSGQSLQSYLNIFTRVFRLLYCAKSSFCFKPKLYFFLISYLGVRNSLSLNRFIGSLKLLVTVWAGLPLFNGLTGDKNYFG